MKEHLKLTPAEIKLCRNIGPLITNFTCGGKLDETLKRVMDQCLEPKHHQVLAMKSQGKSLDEMADHFGKGRSTISRIISEAGLRIRKRAELLVKLNT